MDFAVRTKPCHVLAGEQQILRARFEGHGLAGLAGPCGHQDRLRGTHVHEVKSGARGAGQNQRLVLAQSVVLRVHRMDATGADSRKRSSMAPGSGARSPPWVSRALAGPRARKVLNAIAPDAAMPAAAPGLVAPNRPYSAKSTTARPSRGQPRNEHFRGVHRRHRDRHLEDRGDAPRGRGHRALREVFPVRPARIEKMHVDVDEARKPTGRPLFRGGRTASS